jgi:Protein of unknown function (DUF2752)
VKSTSFTINRFYWRKIIGIAIAALALVIPIFIVQNDGDVEHSQSICPFKLLTGMPCPGCGITKSIVFLYQGEWDKSLSYHLFGPLVVVVALFAIVLLSVELIIKRSLLSKFLYNVKLGYVLGAILGTYHLIRLISFLATHSFDQILQESIWK